MSKHNNVNPGQYKVAGRERPGRDLVQEDHKAQYTTSKPPAKGRAPEQTSPTSKTGKRNTE